MKTGLFLTLFWLICTAPFLSIADNNIQNNVNDFKELMDSLSRNSTDPLLILHYNSMKYVVEENEPLSTDEANFISEAYDEFRSDEDGNPSYANSYYARQRSLVLAWTSPTDGQVSFTKMKLPRNYDPEKSYPMYVNLHGLWSVADNPIEYMTYSFRNGPSSSIDYEDGFRLSMWGRGNLWYQGISETDIWEGIAYVESIVHVDQTRKFITGHSMGGYGAWSIAAKSANVWAGVGIHAGALWYGSDNMLSADKIEALSQVPVYFVCGTQDGLIDINRNAYYLLQEANNPHVEFVTFDGGHEYRTEDVVRMYEWLRVYQNDRVTSNNKTLEASNGECTIHFNNDGLLQITLEKKADMEIAIFNMHGQMVFEFGKRNLNPGQHYLDPNEATIAEGVYIVRIKSPSATWSQKIMID